ncbi:hypothetical protein I3760_05G151000 [Carya illinoinensis]|nr:hypothetical protein I3760_05G151000 [Carya illinoinensis]
MHNYSIGRDVSNLTCFEISSASSNPEAACSIDGLCCLSPVHDNASFSISPKASSEYSPLSLGSANSVMSPPLVRDLACEPKTCKWFSGWKNKGKGFEWSRATSIVTL